jgi:hypothetical protein
MTWATHRRRSPAETTSPPRREQKQGYVSRAAFKLIEIQKKHKVIRPGRSWSKRHAFDHLPRSCSTHPPTHSTPSNPCTTKPTPKPKPHTKQPGGRVLDLGCVPGAWLQVACQEIGPKDRGGLVLGIDLQEAKVPPRFCDDRVKVMTADARLLTPEALMEYAPEVGGLTGV